MLPTSTASAASADHYAYTNAKVIKVAKRYAGSRYAFGGDSPSGFDCSGFTKYVFAKFGISLPHSAWAQSKLGKRVSEKKAEAGDLVITAGGAHVGIYVGNGKFIDAPKPGKRVHVREIYTSNHYFVRLTAAVKAEKVTERAQAKAAAAEEAREARESETAAASAAA